MSVDRREWALSELRETEHRPPPAQKGAFSTCRNRGSHISVHEVGPGLRSEQACQVALLLGSPTGSAGPPGWARAVIRSHSSIHPVWVQSHRDCVIRVAQGRLLAGWPTAGCQALPLTPPAASKHHRVTQAQQWLSPGGCRRILLTVHSLGERWAAWKAPQGWGWGDQTHLGGHLQDRTVGSLPSHLHGRRWVKTCLCCPQKGLGTQQKLHPSPSCVNEP